MIHFDFKLDDIDAENLFDCIQQEQNHMQEKEVECLFQVSMGEGNAEELKAKMKWFKDHRAYLESLMKKLTHKRV